MFWAAGAAGQEAPRASDGAVETVIVTATKRAEDLQKVPISVTALSEDLIKKTDATRFEDVVRAIPGLSYNENSAGSATYTIRGVNTSSSVSNVQSPVAVYLDEVPVLDPFGPHNITDLRLFDVGQVEVLRGPQGTLFGSGALGGAIRLATNKPDASAYDAAAEATVESVENGGVGYRLNGMANIPLNDTLALRIVGYYDRDPGWIDNTTRHEADVNRAVTKGGRAMLRWTPTDDLTLTGTFLYENDHPNDAAYTSYTNKNLEFTSATANFAYQDLKTYNLAAEYTLPWATITSSTSFVDKTELEHTDFTTRSEAITHIMAPAPIVDSGPSGDFIQEVRIASADEHPFKWLAGVYYQHYYRSFTESLTVPGAGARFAGAGYPSDTILFDLYRVKVVEEAVFGELSYDLTDTLTATAGARVFNDSVRTTDDGNSVLEGLVTLRNAATFTKVTPKFALTYTPSQDLMFYAQATQGYRVGQGNLSPPFDPSSGQPIPGAYGPDNLWNYEIGFKTEFFDHRLRLDGAAYYIDWKNIQLQQSTVASGLVYTSNAGNATVKGFEIEADASPIDGLDLGVSLSYDDARLDSVATGVNALAGDQLPGSAPFTGYTYAQYDFPIGGGMAGYMRADYRYTGKEYADLNNPTSLVYGNFGDVNLELGLTVDKFDINLFVNNLTDGRALISARKLFNAPIGLREQPRTVGVTLRAHL